MDSLSFKVAEYNAPLDLILHLLSKHKLNIFDIDISSLLSQYIEIIDSWQEKNLEVASEFLAMASRLVYIKTVSLLPRHEEESKQLREDLSGELMEYHICKLAAGVLGEQNIINDVIVRKQMDIDYDPVYRQNHSAIILYDALVDAMGKANRRKPPSRQEFDSLVNKPFVSVSSKIFTILRSLRVNKVINLDDIFDYGLGKSGLVATFLAVLELMKSGRISMNSDNALTLKNAA